MEKTGSKPSPYRWIVLIALMAVTLVIELQWLAHASVARVAEFYYAGQFNPDSVFNIDFLALSYMVVFLLVSIPASWVIDSRGIKTGLGIGCILTAVFSLLKGLGGNSFPLVVAAQIGLATAQPFILNAVTAVAARWFPLRERGTAAGLAALAQYLGIAVAMGITPLLVISSPGNPDYGKGMSSMLLVYGIISAVTAVAAFFLIKERPRGTKAEDRYTGYKFGEGFKSMLSRRDMLLALLLFFIGLGIFNAVSSMVDSITGSLGVPDSNGLIGVVMIVGGIIGAVILPILSDKFMKRKLFLVITMAGMVPALTGLAFADKLFTAPSAVYSVALISAFMLGFFVMSAGPIGFQYAAEISYPVPESGSQGLLLLAGQISGIVFTALMSIKSNILLKPVMVVFTLLSIVSFVLVLFLKESPLVQKRG
jgi:MFS family permease